jgi:hypothetical protein
MACERVQIPGGPVAIVCGLRRKKAAACKFCGQPSSKLCDWKCERFELVPYRDVKVGDTVRRAVDSNRPNATVMSIEGSPDSATLRFTIEIHSRPPRLKTFDVGIGSRCRVLRPGTCDNPICELHSRNVDEYVDYCMDHWHSWKEIK